MLGIHRPGVTTAIGALTKAGLIEHSRNRIVFSSPDKLAAHACTCDSEISGALRRF